MPPLKLKKHGGDNVPMEQDALIYYTNGTRKNRLVGMRIYNPSLRQFKVLKGCVFQNMSKPRKH
jgi:hypothetical protein